MSRFAEPWQDQPGHAASPFRAAPGERGAEIPLQDSGEPFEIADDDGTVEPQVVTDRGHGLRRGGLAEDGAGEIAGQHLQRRENDDGNGQQGKKPAYSMIRLPSG